MSNPSSARFMRGSLRRLSRGDRIAKVGGHDTPAYGAMAAKLAAVPKTSLTAEDWADAALDALATGGLEAVAVEALARRLKVTKGSFYWHFGNRDELIKAALEAWER